MGQLEMQWKENLKDWITLSRRIKRQEYICPILCILRRNTGNIGSVLHDVVVTYKEDTEEPIIAIVVEENGETKSLTLSKENPFYFIHGKDKNGKYIVLKNLNQ